MYILCYTNDGGQSQTRDSRGVSDDSKKTWQQNLREGLARLWKDSVFGARSKLSTFLKIGLLLLLIELVIVAIFLRYKHVDFIILQIVQCLLTIGVLCQASKVRTFGDVKREMMTIQVSLATMSLTSFAPAFFWLFRLISESNGLPVVKTCRRSCTLKPSSPQGIAIAATFCLAHVFHASVVSFLSWQLGMRLLQNCLPTTKLRPAKAGHAPTRGGTNNLQCLICLADFEPSNLVINLPCHHRFHPECIGEWVRFSSTCPFRCDCGWLELPNGFPKSLAGDAPHEANSVEAQPGPMIVGVVEEALDIAGTSLSRPNDDDIIYV